MIIQWERCPKCGQSVRIVSGFWDVHRNADHKMCKQSGLGCSQQPNATHAVQVHQDMSDCLTMAIEVV